MTMENKIVKVYVLKGLNGTSLVIENYRVSNEKIYGMLTPIYTFEVATDDILQAIGLEYNQSDDCVSRQAVLDCLTATGLKKFDFILDAREKVNNLPPVRPTRKVGKWIKTGGSFRCSECMVMQEFKDIRTLKYCPNCAAEMRGYENE